ncbi:MAG: 2-oxoacid:acceptor oxidoreductase family protein [Betaproteobacteria bacterium]|nr:2-oxoacid:acceptor oxidoreductase family protein [Betaproteobacteria bacterium]
MSYDRRFATTWQLLLDSICTLMGLDANREPPIVLSSLPDLPYQRSGREGAAPLSFIQGPPGRNIALAIGLRAAKPNTPLVLIMSADSITLGTNHLIHAARRNIGMTLLLLRAEVTAAAAVDSMDRAGWDMPAYQRELETASRPLEWASALGASFVARADLEDPDQLAHLLHRAIDTPGFSVIGVTAGAQLQMGVLSENAWPEYFDAYREWTKPLLRLAVAGSQARAAPARSPTHVVPRFEVRIAGLGGHGVKLAGTVLSEAAGFHEGLWATQRGDYGSATRGGPSVVDVVMSSDPITYPAADHPDALIVLSQGAANRFAKDLKPGARVIIDPAEVSSLPAGAIAVPITALAREHTGKPIAAGIVSLGCVAALTDAVSLESLSRSMAAHVPRAIAEKNRAACAAGYAATRAAITGGVHV